jgi:ankyrin repeat protein
MENLNVKQDAGREPPLVWAVWHDADAKALEELLDGGALVNAQDSKGSTPLVAAVAKGNLSSVQLLLARGADTTIATNAGCTPLVLATMNGRRNIGACLIEAGASFVNTNPALLGGTHICCLRRCYVMSTAYLGRC